MNDVPERKSAQRFEPPPWEREQFDELARRREEALAEAEITEAVAALADDETDTALKVADEELPRHADDEAVVAGTGLLDETTLAAMMTQLRMEEPEKDDSLWKVGVAFSGLAAVIGSVLVVWGLAALFKAKDGGVVAMMGGFTLLVFGGLFVGVGMWMAVKSLKQRGVL